MLFGKKQSKKILFLKKNSRVNLFCAALNLHKKMNINRL